jgi:ATP-binding cassette, subfamily B, bacterial
MIRPDALGRAAPQPRPPGSGGWIRRLSPFLMAHRRDVFIAFGFSVAGQAVASITPLISKVIIDEVIVADLRPIGPLLVALVVAGLFGFVAAYVRRFVGGRVSLDVQYDLRNAVYERLQRLDFGTHDRMHTGQLVSRASTDVGLLQAVLSFLPIMLGNLVMVVLSLAFMLYLSPPLTLVALTAIPLMFIVAVRLRTTIFPATWDAQQRAGEVAGVVDESVTGVRVVKGFGQEDRERRHLAATGADLYRSRARLVRLQAKYTPALAAIPVFAQVAVLGFGGWLAIEGSITLGTFLAFSTYLVQLVAPVRMFATLLAVGQQARAGGERLLDILDTNALVTEAEDAPELDVVRGAVRFDDIRFGYTSTDAVLDGFSLDVAPGETVALVGASGSGKSTVALLLPRFYDVNGGAITIDGVDVRAVTLDSLRCRVGVVFEESFLFSDSVRDNIAYGRPDATDEEVVAAARAAEADTFIRALPEGYDTLVGERGLTLSGGQRQRVALARALLTDPRILILDDATSSIDSATEEDIHATLRSVMRGRTTLLVAHRRSSLRLADRIALVDHGTIVAQGTHEELMASSRLYRDLLAGPGDDVEHIEPEPVVVNVDALEHVAGITPALWPHDRVGAAAKASATVAGPARMGPGGGAAGGGMAAALAPTPELLEALDRLPPADDDPEVDIEAEARAPAERFSLRRFLLPYRRPLAIGFGLVGLDTVLTLLGPLLVSRGIDQGVRPGDTEALWLATAAFALVVLIDWIVTWGYTWVTGRTAERLLYALRIRIFSQLQRLSLDYYDKELGGRVMTRMTTDVESLSQLLQTGLINAIVSLFTCVGVFIFLVILSPPLALAAATVIPPLVLSTWWYRRLSGRAYTKARDSIAMVNANLQESLSGVRVAQAYVREDRNIAGFRTVNHRYLSDRLGAQRLIALYFPFILLLATLGEVVVLGVGSELVHNGTVTAGVVIAFLLYLDQFFSPIQQLSQVFDTWQQASASMVKIDELMATPTGTPELADAESPRLGRAGADISFEGVRFRYPGTVGAEALAGVSLRIAAGETVALVGETGAGKSTIVKLVARYYDPSAGAVLVDGHDLRTVDLGGFRRQLGVVPQEAFLFTGTIRDNIAYGRPDATDAEVEAAAVAVGAHELVAGLPDGYLSEVTERGRSLSAGQRQLIALARARLVDPAILLLDEATSNLDLASEARVQRAMGLVAEGRTTLLVAHRLPTARRADRILVVDDGLIIEEGTHDELVALDGRYTELWAAFATGEGDADRSAVPVS